MSRNGNSLFWMVALPLKHRETAPENTVMADEDRNSLYSFLKDKLGMNGDLADVYRFSFPEFKVGTLDSLVSAGEDLAKMDPQVESVVTRLIANLKTLLGSDSDQVRSSLVINEGNVYHTWWLNITVASPEAYVTSFQWNIMKYRTDKTVTETSEMIIQEIQQIDNLLKSRLVTFNQSKASVAAIERKSTGNLLTKDLAPFVDAKDFIPSSEYMKTLLVVVPALLKSQWEASYEHLCEMVVPRSSSCLFEEDEYALYNVTVFTKFIKDFTKAATAEKFVVREFIFDETVRQETTKSDEAMQKEFKVQLASLLRLLKTNFGEIFSAWIHLKVLRLFVESVLHYGLPPQFLALILRPSGGKDQSKAERKLRLALLQTLEKLGLPGISPIDIAAAIQTSNDHPGDTAEEAELWSALNMATQDENPFVKVPLKLPI